MREGSSLLLERRRIPWPLWVFAGWSLWVAIMLEIRVRGPIAAQVLFAALTLAWLYFLLRGVRWIWMTTIGICGLSLLSEVIFDSIDWQGFLVSLIGLLLLVLPITRQYVLGRNTGMARPG